MVRQHADLAHVDEGRGEIGEELVGRGGIGLAHHVGPGVPVEEQRGVGGEEPPARRDIPVVPEVERGAAARVEVDQGGEVAGPALAPERRRVVGIKRRVGGAVVGGEVVEARGEGGAVSLANGVRAGEHGEVLGGEVEPGEEGDEVGDVGARLGSVGGDVGGRRPVSVLPPRRDQDVRPLGLADTDKINAMQGR